MSSIINIGLTGLQANQTALATTGNNVSNANTEGYTRQRAEFESTPSQFIGSGYLGSGVAVADITRLTNQFLISQVRIDTSVFNEIDKLRSNVSQIDSLLADSTTGLAPGLSDFFKSLQGASDDPSSVPARQLIISQAEGLVSRFNVLYGRLDAQASNVNLDMHAQVTQLNSLAKGIAEVNRAIVTAKGNASGVQPNDLLDKRDQMIRELSEIVSVSVQEQSDGQYNVLIGKGQSLVIGSNANSLQLDASPDDPNQLEINLINSNRATVVTSQIVGGQLGGLIRFRDEILVESFNSLGRIGVVLADTINEQHQLGMDLENNLGGLFFEDINSDLNRSNRVIPNSENAQPSDREIYVDIVDSNMLTTRDYRLEFDGPTDNDILITDANTGETITRGRLPGLFPTTFEFDGLEITFESGSFQTGDSFLVVPTRFGARDIDNVVARVEELALAAPIRTEADLGNVGNAGISAGEVLAVRQGNVDALLPTFAVPGELSPPLLVRFITDTYYEVLDNTDPSNPVPLVPPKNNEKYIVGVENELFTADPFQTGLSALGTGVAQIPAPGAGPFSNGYLSQVVTIQSRDPDTGIVTNQAPLNIANDATAEQIASELSSRNGVTATAYTIVQLDNFVGGVGSTVTINGEVLTIPATGTFGSDDLADLINNDVNLISQDVVAYSDGTTLTIRDMTGKDITVEVGAGASLDISTANAGPVAIAGGQGTSVGGFVDVRLDEGYTLRADNNNVFEQNPIARSTYLGYQASISGTPAQGDLFTIEYNEGGTSDNRNILAMASLEVASTIGDGNSTYNESYSQLVEVVGSVASQAILDSESAKSLLTQSENRWLEQAGVNLDEEAGRLIQYQAAYNASAQVVSVARQLFDTLLATFG